MVSGPSVRCGESTQLAMAASGTCGVLIWSDLVCSSGESDGRSKWPLALALGQAGLSKLLLEPASEPQGRSSLPRSRRLALVRAFLGAVVAKVKLEIIARRCCLCSAVLCIIFLCAALLRAWTCTGTRENEYTHDIYIYIYMYIM